MRLGLKLLATGAALALSTQANAQSVTGQISIGGYVAPIGSTGMSSATGLDFVNGPLGAAGSTGILTSYGGGTGSFAGFGCSGSCGTIVDIPSFAGFTGQNGFFTLTGGPSAVSFDLASITNIMRTSDSTGGALTLNGSGFFNYAGLSRTAATFSLTAQGSNVTSFSASAVAAAVPEPATWAMMLMGFGMVGAAMRYRRRTTKVAFA